MPLSSELFNFIEQKQEKYENTNLLPNDAIYLLRVNNLKAVCDLIEELVNESGKSIQVVINQSVKPNLSIISETYPFTSEALNLIVKKYEN